jgi:hypothetical protein
VDGEGIRNWPRGRCVLYTYPGSPGQIRPLVQNSNYSTQKQVSCFLSNKATRFHHFHHCTVHTSLEARGLHRYESCSAYLLELSQKLMPDAEVVGGHQLTRAPGLVIVSQTAKGNTGLLHIS